MPTVWGLINFMSFSRPNRYQSSRGRNRKNVRPHWLPQSVTQFGRDRGSPGKGFGLWPS